MQCCTQRGGGGIATFSCSCTTVKARGVFTVCILENTCPLGERGGGRGVGTYQMSFGDKMGGYEEGGKCEKWEKKTKGKGKIELKRVKYM